MIRIDTENPLAPVHQIVQQLVDAIIVGDLPTETRLPTVRQLAADLGLANGTVAKAYQILEQNGYLETRGRKGTFVRGSHATIDPKEAQKQLSDKAQQLVLVAAMVGADEEQVLNEVRQAFSRRSAKRQPGSDEEQT